MKDSTLKILLLLTVLMAIGCIGDDVDIENNRRLLVKGKITDPEGAPISNLSVITSSFGDALGQTTSDAGGNFSLVSLDEKFDPLDIFINVSPYNFTTNNEYSSRSFLSEQHTTRVLYDMGTIVLGQRAKLNLIINNLPGDTNTLDFELNFTPAECRLPLNIIDPPTSCNLSESIIRNMNTTSENQSYTIESVMGSTVIFEYSLNFGPRETIEIPLTKIDTEYVFEY